MKKTLLTTTAIIAAFAATDANASNLQVNIGGFADFQAGYVSDDIVDGIAGANKKDFNTDAEIHLSVEGASDNGLEYGAVLELEANVGDTTDPYDNGLNADKAYLFIQGGWGRVEMGENTGAEEALAVNTGNFASATGGVDGDFYRYLAVPTFTGGNLDNGDGITEISNTNPFFGLLKPKLALAQGGNANALGTDEDATKITYYSPRFAGFQIGASYIPNSADTSRSGATVGTVATGVADFEDIFTGGINYTNQFDQVGVAASLTGLTGDAKAGGGDIEGYAAGANLTFAGFTVGGSYGDYRDTLGVDADYYDLGLGYSAGPFSASVTYLKSRVEQTATIAGDDFTIDNAGGKFKNIVVGVDYQLAPGLVPYAEVAFFDADAGGNTIAGGAQDNDGTIFMLGTQLSF